MNIIREAMKAMAAGLTAEEAADAIAKKIMESKHDDPSGLRELIERLNAVKGKKGVEFEFIEVDLRGPNGCPDPECVMCTLKRWIKEKTADGDISLRQADLYKRLPDIMRKLDQSLDCTGWTQIVWDTLIEFSVVNGFNNQAEILRIMKTFNEKLSEFTAKMDERGEHVYTRKPTTATEASNPPAAEVPNMDGASAPAAGGPSPKHARRMGERP